VIKRNSPYDYKIAHEILKTEDKNCYWGGESGKRDPNRLPKYIQTWEAENKILLKVPYVIIDPKKCMDAALETLLADLEAAFQAAGIQDFDIPEDKVMETLLTDIGKTTVNKDPSQLPILAEDFLDQYYIDEDSCGPEEYHTPPFHMFTLIKTKTVHALIFYVNCINAETYYKAEYVIHNRKACAKADITNEPVIRLLYPYWFGYA